MPGPRRTPVDVLSREHQQAWILVVLGVMDAEQHRLADRVLVRRPSGQRCWSSSSTTRDRCHHGKEELVVVELERAGLPATRSDRVHAEGARRSAVRAARRWWLPCGGRRRCGVGHGRRRLRGVAAGAHRGAGPGPFPMAKSVLDQAAVARLRRGFAWVHHHDLGAGDPWQVRGTRAASLPRRSAAPSAERPPGGRSPIAAQVPPKHVFGRWMSGK